jgi:ABC-type branched-subunit amino acid transport system substrate-binding protein
VSRYRGSSRPANTIRRGATVLFAGVALIAGAFVGGATAGASGIPSGPITVGMIEPESGSLAILGTGIVASTRAFIDQLNAAGGIDGHQLKLIALNDQGDPATAVSEAQQLAADHITVAFGASLGSSLAEVVPVWTKDKIIIINNEATDSYSQDTSKYPYFYNVQPINLQDMTAMVDYAKKAGYKVGILGDGLPYSQNLISDFKARAAKSGVKVVATETYSPTAVSLTTQVTALKDAGATAVATLGETQFPAIYQAMTQIGFNVGVLGDAVTPLEPGAPAKTVEPCMAPLKVGEALPAGEASVYSVVKAAGAPLYSMVTAPLYRDEVQMYAAAVKAAKSTSTAAVVAQLNKMTKVHPTAPGYLQTFTSKSHAGWAGVDTACQVTPLGADGYPIVAPAPTP